MAGSPGGRTPEEPGQDMDCFVSGERRLTKSHVVAFLFRQSRVALLARGDLNKTRICRLHASSGTAFKDGCG